jgi:hypothetical protein
LVFPFALYFAEAVGAPIHALPANQFLIEKPQSSSGSFEFHDTTGIYRDTQLRGHLAQKRSMRINFSGLFEGLKRAPRERAGR